MVEELKQAPDKVKDLFYEIFQLSEQILIDPAILALQEEYLKAGILTDKWREDALHVALATISNCRVIVSWNFKHIVHFQKIPKYNAVNTLLGLPNIAIHSPQELIEDEEDE
ncbi:MAG: hypothetical protein HQM09_22755 [Candidatus Riflebacteria bacterium]|nr:hypothetical protein [Candidatus Riflebacteria bacterium]